MEPTLNLFAVLNLLGAAQALLLALALVTVRRGRRERNLTLAAFAAVVAVQVAWVVFTSSRFYLWFPHLLRVNHPFDFAVAPLFYLYVRSLTAPKAGLKRRDLLHFVPAALCAVYLLPYYLSDGDFKLANQSGPADVRWYYVRASLVITLTLFYLVLAGRRVGRYLRAAPADPTPAARADAFQLKFVVGYVCGLWLLALLRYAVDVYDPRFLRYTNLVLPFGATVFVYALAFLALRRPGGLAGQGEEAAPQPQKKYEKSALTPERSDAFLKRLLDVMKAEKPYTDGGLTLPRLAARLSVSTHHLSQVINERLGQSFNDFVNSYRVEEAKRRLADPSATHYSLLAIAEEVGFNSKSSFNTAFKKQTGMTPSEFRNSGQNHPR